MPTGSLPPRVEALTNGCPGPEVRPQFPPDGRLPNGATQVRVCNFTGDLMTFKRDRVEEDFLVPIDALTTNVDAVVDLINAAAPQKAADSRTYCAGVGAPTQVLWFSYPDTDLAVTYNDGTCKNLDLGEIEVEGGDAVAAAFSDLLWEQRDRQRPPEQIRRARCAPNLTKDTPLVLADRLNLVDAVICEYTSGVRQARLTPTALDAVNADYATTYGFEEQGGCPQRMMRGITAWGDQFTWWATCWDFLISNTYPTGLHWKPAPEVQDLLDSLPRGPSRRQVTTHPGQSR